MIIIDIRLGRFSFLVQRESDHRTIRMTREPGEIIIDLPYLRLFLTDHHHHHHHHSRSIAL